MKSRIMIDVDYQNRPILKIQLRNSEDLRDKIVARFLDRNEKEELILVPTSGGEDKDGSYSNYETKSLEEVQEEIKFQVVSKVEES